MPAPPVGAEELVLQGKQVLGAVRSQGLRERKRRRRQWYGSTTYEKKKVKNKMSRSINS